MTHVQLWLACLALVTRAIGSQGVPAAAAAPVAAPASGAWMERGGVERMKPASGSKVSHFRLSNPKMSGWFDHVYKLEEEAKCYDGAS